jgi:hypothetical protein
VTRLVLPALALCLLAAGCGGGGDDDLSVAAPHFRAASDWHVGTQPAQRCPGVSRTRCVQANGWASSVPYRDCGNCVPPHRTLAALPPAGIVIQELDGRERPSRIGRTPWPPRIGAGDVTGPFEGEPPKYGVFQFSARTGSVERSLFVWFGRPHPTPHQLVRANAELHTVR